MFKPQLTKDGSFTFFSPDFQETFHSHSGAKQEAEHKFIIPSQIAQKAQTQNIIKILDICYGLGYNSATALAKIWQINPQCQVELIALELDINVVQQAIKYRLLEQWEQPIPQFLSQLAEAQQLVTTKLQANLYLDDARDSIKQVEQSGFKADAIFLDPFSPPKCPQLWTVEFLQIVAQCLQPKGRLVTYSCAASVRTALKLAGLELGASASIGRRSPGTIASFSTQELPPLSQQEQEHLQTRAAIPYRDPQLEDNVTTIKQRRQQEQQSSNLEPSSHWKKRWSFQ